MEENTPRFYHTIEEDKELESVFSFSVEYKKTSRTKSNSKRHSKRSSFHHHSNSKHKKSKTNLKINLNCQKQVLISILIKNYL